MMEDFPQEMVAAVLARLNLGMLVLELQAFVILYVVMVKLLVQRHAMTALMMVLDAKLDVEVL